MTSFKKMRENMILGQFLPGLIKEEILIEVFSEVEREKFLKDNLQALAYSDINLKISEDRFLISPFNYAKILEAAKIKKKEMVLLIGAGTGYETIILSKIAGTVIAIEEDRELSKISEENLKNYDLDNVVNIKGKLSVGLKKHAPYDVIIILGSIDELNKKILEQLSEEGRLLTCMRLDQNLEESKLTIYYKHNKKYVKNILFDLNLPKLLSLRIKNNQFKLIN